MRCLSFCLSSYSAQISEEKKVEYLHRAYLALATSLLALHTHEPLSKIKRSVRAGYMAVSISQGMMLSPLQSLAQQVIATFASWLYKGIFGWWQNKLIGTVNKRMLKHYEEAGKDGGKTSELWLNVSKILKEGAEEINSNPEKAEETYKFMVQINKEGFTGRYLNLEQSGTQVNLMTLLKTSV